MNRSQFMIIQTPVNELKGLVKFNMVQIGLSTEPRTLLYGYDCDRNTHHVYVDPSSGCVMQRIYSSLDIKEVNNVTEDGISSYDALVPNKRLYPQYCDYEFCAFLKSHGVHMSFTTYNEPTDDRKVFAGEIA